MMWIQGTFLMWEYGLLDGQSIDWEMQEWRGWIDASIWILIIASCVIFHKAIYRISTFACIVLIPDFSRVTPTPERVGGFRTIFRAHAAFLNSIKQ
ncbi:MAG: hypothetical protein GY846_10950 [Deltaproteobacteria bacterium]|nr:hypothetical protein [Deltaproteobacteria bacterium]